MSDVLIIVNAELEREEIIKLSPATRQMLMAMNKAISRCSPRLVNVEVIAAALLWSKPIGINSQDSNLIYCPLTIELPHHFSFPQQPIYQACKNIKVQRDWVEQNLEYKTSIGNAWLGYLWLPIVLTENGSFYGEVIAEAEMPNVYEQPYNLSAKHRQKLYYLAEELLTFLSASPAVYLLQFGLWKQEIIFDRLWPFPAAPALASLGVQKPDLFACHWCCLTNQPISELIISRST